MPVLVRISQSKTLGSRSSLTNEFLNELLAGNMGLNGSTEGEPVGTVQGIKKRKIEHQFDSIEVHRELEDLPELEERLEDHNTEKQCSTRERIRAALMGHEGEYI